MLHLSENGSAKSCIEDSDSILSHSHTCTHNRTSKNTHKISEQREMNGKRVLIIGGTGYVGQHLLEGLSNTALEQGIDLAFTHHSNLPPEPLLKAIHSHCLAFPVDLRNGDGFDAISLTFGQVTSINFMFYTIIWLLYACMLDYSLVRYCNACLFF